MLKIPRSAKDFERFMLARGITMGEIDARARYAFTVYVQCRSDFYPGYRGTYTPDIEAHMRKFVAGTIIYGLDIQNTLCTLFELYGKDLRPNQLHSEAALRRVPNATAELRQIHTLEIQLASQKLLREREAGKTMRDAIIELAREASDTFVYCVSKSAGFDDIAAAVEPNARRLMLNPAIHAVYAEHFPEVVK